MKKLLTVAALSVFLTACGGGNDEKTTVSTGDSLAQAADSVMQTGDTTALNGRRGDSTSASGIHGGGSGSRVGGGVTGGAQGQTDKTADSGSQFGRH